MSRFKAQAHKRERDGFDIAPGQNEFFGVFMQELLRKGSKVSLAQFTKAKSRDEAYGDEADLE